MFTGNSPYAVARKTNELLFISAFRSRNSGKRVLILLPITSGTQTDLKQKGKGNRHPVFFLIFI
jgi:hypothetical protein